MNTLKRGEEKLKRSLEWIATFQFTNMPVLAKRLKIHRKTLWHGVNRLKERGLIQLIPIYEGHRKVLMLTSSGLELAMRLCAKRFLYHTEPSKLNIHRIYHDLCVQTAVVNRVGQGGEFYAEWNMPEEYKKMPDALIVQDGKKIALEIKLSPKADSRIYRGFTYHTKTMIVLKQYDHVEYVFENDTLKHYYLKRFNTEKWPIWRWNEETKEWYTLEHPFCPDKTEGVRTAFSFVQEKLYE